MVGAKEGNAYNMQGVVGIVCLLPSEDLAIRYQPTGNNMTCLCSAGPRTLPTFGAKIPFGSLYFCIWLQDESTFDLPPTQIAKPLPVNQPKPKENGQRGAKAKGEPEQPAKNLKRKRVNTPKDDAPRAFKRLMAYAGGKRPRSGLDNGDKPRGAKGKKRGTAQHAKSTETKAEEKSAPRRSQLSVPENGFNKSTKGNKDPLGLKVWRTNKERKMHKMYDEWREQDRKIKEKREEKREEELDLEAEKELEEEESGVSWKLNVGNQLSGKRKKKSKDDDDPWAVLRKKRGETRPGLRDVATAPPELTIKPSKQLLVRGAAVKVENIPKAAGSLKRREELQATRNDIVAAYRKKMAQKRPSLHTL
ncbi:hypothetical protein EKO27_g3617 [Xylaria grammica]|uniref:Uncharacterized protein n=1 Tax=Xylaria grammica TaxID=363999 RepID=A0A439DAP6_9PEZI|nr:hypothetical protein EKO27_g3617 [Xylaria grammica]